MENLLSPWLADFQIYSGFTTGELGCCMPSSWRLTPGWLIPISELIPYQPPIREEASLGCVATVDHSFQVVVCCHGNNDVSMLRIICSLMEMVSL